MAPQCKWNTSGSILSVAGTPRQPMEGSREVSSINFYDAYGRFIRTLKVRRRDTILVNSPAWAWPHFVHIYLARSCRKS